MKVIKKVGWLSFLFFTVVSCNVTKTTTKITANQSKHTTEKLSIGEKLKEHNHLPIEKRIALYHQLKKDYPNDYNFENEKALNDYGYTLLNSKLKEEAIEIFKLNVEQFPNSADVYNSLADAYNNLSFHYRELSKENHEKALKIWSILDMDETWGMEIFHFPLRFAKDINYTGIEEARFPPKGWSDTTSNYFWTYLFAWDIHLDTIMSIEEVEDNLKLYYDGLMSDVNKNKAIDPKITTVKLQEQNTDKSKFTGKLTIFDAFRTQKALELNAVVSYDYCEEKKTTQLIFMLSPKPLDDEVWTELKTAKFREGVCK